MSARTISFPKGEGSLRHNNREFVADNVSPERTEWNITYIRESLPDAYEKCFGDAVREYNAGQKRKDRQIGSYIKKIENSNNGENVFYENIVQIGTKYDTAVVDKTGGMTEAAKEAVAILDEYAKTFQERNPNLYLFNCVLHLDEATPHLHIDYIPVAHGYKTGMKTRNSISKALQEMGFEKGKGRFDNEVIDWEKREREYLMGMCRERAMEVEIKGDKRDNLALPEYKAAMRKVEGLEVQAEDLERRKDALEQHTEDLRQQEKMLSSQVSEIEVHNRQLTERARELVRTVKGMEAKEKENRKILEDHDLRADTLKTIKKETDTDTKKMKSAAVPMSNLFGSEEYVKVKKSDWDKILDAFSRAVSRNHLLEKYEKKIEDLEHRAEKLAKETGTLKQFVDMRGLRDEYLEYLKSLEPRSIREWLDKRKEEIAEHDRQKSKDVREMPWKGKASRQEIGA